MPEASFIFIIVAKIVLFLLIIFIFNKLLTIREGFLEKHIVNAIEKLTKESQFFYILVFGI